MYLAQYCVALFSTFILIECTVNFSQPLNTKEYQGIIGQGFATTYFYRKLKASPLKYSRKNIEDIYEKGFRNVRLRTRASHYDPPYNDTDFETFLTNLEEVVDDCLEIGVTPIITWEHHEAEANATVEDRDNYLTWWTKVAKKLKNKSYHLAFNLFTELGVDYCDDKSSCPESLARNITKYNNWTKSVVEAIRETGGNNEKRVLILASPRKIAAGLLDIDYNDEVFRNDSYLMVEWHDYAGGPNKKWLPPGTKERKSRRYWTGNGLPEERKNLQNALKIAEKNVLPTYFGAWMPRDNKAAALNQSEVNNFAQFFVRELKAKNIPWSLNRLDDYYDTEISEWITGEQEIRIRPYNGSRTVYDHLDMSIVLDKILEAMHSE